MRNRSVLPLEVLFMGGFLYLKQNPKQGSATQIHRHPPKPSLAWRQNHLLSVSSFPPRGTRGGLLGAFLVRAAWERRPEGPQRGLFPLHCDAPISRRPVCFLQHTFPPIGSLALGGFTKDATSRVRGRPTRPPPPTPTPGSDTRTRLADPGSGSTTQR